MLENPRAIESRRDGGTYILGVFAFVPIGLLAWFASWLWWLVWTTDRPMPRALIGASVTTAIVALLVVAGATKLARIRRRVRPAPGWRTALELDMARGLARSAPDGAWFPIRHLVIEAKIQRRSEYTSWPGRSTTISIDLGIRIAGQVLQLRFAVGDLPPSTFAPYPLLPEIDAALRELSGIGFGIRIEQPTF